MQTKLALDVKARFLNLKKFKLKTECSTKTALLANLVKDYLMLDPSVLSNCKTNTLKFFVKDVTAVSQVKNILNKNYKLCSYTEISRQKSKRFSLLSCKGCLTFVKYLVRFKVKD